MVTERKPTGFQWLWGMSDWPEFEQYQSMGGGLSYNQWKAQGKSRPPTALSATAADIYKRTGQPIPPKARVAPATPGETVGMAQRQAKQITGKVSEKEAFGMPVRWGTVTEGGWVYNVGYDAKGNIVSREPLGRAETITPETISPYQQAQLDLTRQEAERQTGRQTWEQQESERDRAYRESQLGLQRWQTEQQLAAEEERQQAELGWLREQAGMQQKEAERQEMARLAAQPISWLQYASYTGQPPVTQPWMQPLMGGYQAGQQIPGWSTKSASAIPELLRPSAQYQARMGPTAQQQYLGYEQARTGAIPEETEFRLRSTAPPSGRYGGLRWAR